MKPLLGITAGDPCGVGPEITLKALQPHKDLKELYNIVVIADAAILKSASTLIKLDTSINTIDDISEADFSTPDIICLNISPEKFEPAFGRICREGGLHAYAYLQKAIGLAIEKKIDALVTAPINKVSLRMASVPYLDHTEMLTKMTASSDTMTLFITGDLRVFFYTRHIAFRDIADAMDKESLVVSARNCIRHLQKIGIESPHLAIAALNPHGGEDGLFGDEEKRIIAPAVRQAEESGISVTGPVPADSVFHLAAQGKYDAVLSLYHDQGHIAAKTFDFDRTVALTMGLPFLRTSVDHGTAFDIAGRGIASEISMVEAIRAAGKYYW